MCKLEDIEYLMDQTEFWTVDSEGEPEMYVDVTSDGDFRAYRCTEHDDEEFATWEEVLTHMKENA